MSRRSVNVESFAHTNPIPGASRIGPLLISSVISGRDPGTETVPAAPEAQIANLFHHVGEMLRAGGADWRHIAKMTFFVPDLSYRKAINGPWAERFPDPASRPARHTQLSSGALQCDFIAYVDD
jgi:2-iminobutanoate/2-iminopropanoate deaminase